MALLKKKSKTAGRNRAVVNSEQVVSAYSYHNSRNEFDEKEGRNKERQLKRTNPARSFFTNRFGAIILVIVCLVCLYSVLGLSTSPNIVFLGTNKSDSMLYDIYAHAFEINSTKEFKSSILNHNKITVDTNKITKDLESQFPVFSNIAITLPLINHRPIIYLTPAIPSVVLVNSEGQYLLNQNGVAMLFGSLEDGFNYLNLPMVTDQSGLNMSIGKPALTSQDVSFIQTITTQLSLKHYQVSTMTLPQTSSELDVGLTGKPYYIKFNLEDNSPNRQVGSFLATMSYLSGQNITPGQYVDIRTDGRVYYQ